MFDKQQPIHKTSFHWNFSYMFIGKLVFAVSQWLLLIVIARLTTPNDLGKFTFAIALASPILLATQMNLRAFMATDHKDRFALSDYFATRLFSVIVALLLIGSIASVSVRDFTLITLIVLIASYKSSESISDIFYGVLQRNEHMAPIARALSARGISAVICMLLALQITGNVLVGAATILIAWTLILLIHDYPASKNFMGGPLHSSHPKILGVIHACYPLGLTLGLMSLRINIPVYFIEAHHGTEAVGYYSAIAYFLVAGNLVTGSLLQAAAPRLARNYRDHDTTQFSRFLYRLIAVGGVVGLVGLLLVVVLGQWILATMYGPAYAAHADALIWVMIAATIGYMSQFTGLSLTVSRLFRYHLLSQTLGVVAATSLAWILVPSQGIIGGAMALTAATAVALLCNVIVTHVRVIPSI